MYRKTQSMTPTPKNKTRAKLRNLILVACAAIVLSAAVLPFAVSTAVRADNGTAICSPDNTDSGSSGNIGTCVNDIYIFSLAAGGTLAVLIFVIGGYLYMQGGEGTKTAKTMMTSAVVGLIVLFGTYAFLNTINPDLTSFQDLSLPVPQCIGGGTSCTPSTNNLTASSAGAGSTGTATGGGSCTQGTGDASAAYLSGTCFGAANAQNASEIAQAESSGNSGAHADYCTANGQDYAASWGLFQINLAANDFYVGNVDCKSAFSGAPSRSTLISGNNYNCSVTNVPLYNSCVSAAENDANNINEACTLQQNSRGWSNWSTAAKCGISN